MKPTQYLNLIWFILGLELVAAQVSSDGKDTITCGCHENVLSNVMNKLYEISQKIEIIDSKVNHLESLMPNNEQNRQAIQCDSTEKNLQSTIDSFERKLDLVANYSSFSFENCSIALLMTGRSGVYRLQTPNTSAYCINNPDGGLGWTIIQRRQDGSISFNRTWHDYKNGFGDPSGEYWLGLEKIYAMTSKREYELWIELGDHEGERRQANYAAFEIGNEEEKYYLKSVGTYTGNAVDSLGPAKITRKFSTIDEDNDTEEDKNCVHEMGAWWIDNCNYSSLNGEYNNKKIGRGINWLAWHGWTYSLKYTHMAIRPVH